MLITTGRNPGTDSLLVANALAGAVPGARLWGRGRRTLAAAIEMAGRLRLCRVCAVYQEKGKPAEIAFIAVSPGGSWEWLSPRVRVAKVLASGGKKQPQSQSLKLSGAKAESLKSLLGIESQGEEPESEIMSSPKSMSIRIAGKELLKLGVEYA